MLNLNALFKSFGSKKVLRGVTLEIKSGEIVTLVGDNGSGKTTLLRILTSLDHPDSYTVAEIDGFDLKSDSVEIRSRIGYLPHNPPYYPELTGVENLQLWLDLNSINNSEEVARKRLKINQELLTKQQNELNSQWEKEKESINQIQFIKEEIERIQLLIEQAKRSYDLNKAAELEYGTLDTLQKKIVGTLLKDWNLKSSALN